VSDSSIMNPNITLYEALFTYELLHVTFLNFSTDQVLPSRRELEPKITSFI